VFPSTTDTFGCVILEAHACAVPTIVTDIGGPRDIVIPGETGAIVAGRDPLALKSSIESLLDRERLMQMGLRARALVEAKSFNHTFLEYWKCYEGTTLWSAGAPTGRSASVV